VGDIYDGTSFWFYENGNVKTEKTFSLGKLNGWVRYFYESGLVKEEFYVNDGVKDGLLKRYYENGGLKLVLSYDKGVMTRKTEISFDPNYQAPVEAYKAGNRQYEIQSKNGDLICDSEICPIPIGGLEAIMDTLIYPEHAMLYGLEGTVKLIATISAKGDAIKTTIVEGLGLGCDEAASEAVKSVKFLPGTNEGKSVQSNLTIDIPFRLTDKSGIVRQLDSSTDKILRKVALETDLSQTERKTSGGGVSSNSDLSYKMSDKNFDCTQDFDVCPHPVGGLNSILNNLEIPEIAARVGLKGDVTVITSVDVYGLVRDTKVIKGMGHGCSEAVEVAILETQFEAAIKNGQPVAGEVKITVPINPSKSTQ